MPAFPDWDIDLERGRVKEDLVRRLLTNDEDHLTVETKGDYRGVDTGKHFAEISCKGRPSGLMVTRASYWAVALSNDVVIFVPTERMRELAADALAEGSTARMTAGSHPTEGVLIPLARLIADAA